MIVDPQWIIDRGYLQHTEHSKVQQSGIDVTLKKIRRLFSIENSVEVAERSLSRQHETVGFDLFPGVYDFQCNEFVIVPKFCAAILIVRSSFNRKGTYITTGLYDNDFKNYVGGIMHVSFPITIDKNDRIGQIVFMQSDGKNSYDGQYNYKGDSGENIPKGIS